MVHPETSPSRPKEAVEPVPARNKEVKASYPHVHFNERVLWCLARYLTDQQLFHIKILLRKDTDTGFGISRDQVNGIKTNEHLLDCLQDNKLLSVNNTWFLQFLVFCARNKKIYKETLDFMVERMTAEHPVCVYEPLELRGAVQLKVAGDIEHFLNIDVEAYRQILSENCGNMVKYTNLTGINNGCVKLSFQIPSSSKAVLLKDARNNAEWLTSNGIFQVCVDGEEPINLPKIVQPGPSPAQDRVQLLLSILTREPRDKEDMPSKDLVNSAVGGKPFLHWACERNKTKWVEYLIDHGADVNKTDEMGCTILHKVAFLALPKLCKTLLLTEGVHRFPEDKEQMTPVTIARGEGHEEIIKLFKVFEEIRMKKQEFECRMKKKKCLADKIKDASMKKMEQDLAAETEICYYSYASSSSIRVLQLGMGYQEQPEKIPKMGPQKRKLSFDEEELMKGNQQKLVKKKSSVHVKRRTSINH
ncbi:uncharacterized protein [Amphiura filiformis]|uniref:uncharacterized protein n=1 Tax=Amphiura filiformis TaxID=82378 RepID=UPI003B210825